MSYDSSATLPSPSESAQAISDFELEQLFNAVWTAFVERPSPPRPPPTPANGTVANGSAKSHVAPNEPAKASIPSTEPAKVPPPVQAAQTQRADSPSLYVPDPRISNVISAGGPATTNRSVTPVRQSRPLPPTPGGPAGVPGQPNRPGPTSAASSSSPLASRPDIQHHESQASLDLARRIGIGNGWSGQHVHTRSLPSFQTPSQPPPQFMQSPATPPVQSPAQTLASPRSFPQHDQLRRILQDDSSVHSPMTGFLSAPSPAQVVAPNSNNPRAPIRHQPSRSFDRDGNAENGSNSWQSGFNIGTNLTTASDSEFPILNRPESLVPSFAHGYIPSNHNYDSKSRQPRVEATYNAQNQRGTEFDGRRREDWLGIVSPTQFFEEIDRVPAPHRSEPDFSSQIEDDYDDENQFLNTALLSHIAVRVRDNVPRDTHVKGSIPYENAFTGKDVVFTIQSVISRELYLHNMTIADRRIALDVARSLQSQFFFFEVETGSRLLQDNVENVYVFMDEQLGSQDPVEKQELPTGVVVTLTKCYSTNCRDSFPCYSPRCPLKGEPLPQLARNLTEAQATPHWWDTIPPEVKRTLPDSEVKRQSLIHKIIDKEEQYLKDLDLIEAVYIKPLRNPLPNVTIPDDFVEEIFGNILELRDANRRLLEELYIRQREQAPVIHRIGDIFLGIATQFRDNYPRYVGYSPLAEKTLADELDANRPLRDYIDDCLRSQGPAFKLDIWAALGRPRDHLSKYPTVLKAIRELTAKGNPDNEYLAAAISAFNGLQTVSQLTHFQLAMGRGPTGRWEWHDVVTHEERLTISPEEVQRQSVMFELIKSEMAYVKDLESIEKIYIRPLRASNPPIIPPDRLNSFLSDVFFNYRTIYMHHKRLVEQFHQLQLEEHPTTRSIVAPLFDAALNFREAYLEYIPNYPIATYRIDDEMEKNPAFKQFVESASRHQDASKLDLKSFINRPIPRLLRYELLLQRILGCTPAGHEDGESIPQVIEIIKSLGKETERGVQTAKAKVELWNYNSHLVFRPGESVDMDLLNENRMLHRTGRLKWDSYTELFVLLFDNFFVMTRPKVTDGVTKYHVFRRPVPLELLTPINFADPPIQRTTGLFRNLMGDRERRFDGPLPDNVNINGNGRTTDVVDNRSLYPFAIRVAGRHQRENNEAPWTFFTESQTIREAWRQALDEAINIRKHVQEVNKLFEVETISADNFYISAAGTSEVHDANHGTGRVTCSVPFSLADGRNLIAIGCLDGLWFGYRHDPKSLRRVLNLPNVLQCAVLEDFGLFLVLLDKTLFAYRLEALVPLHGSDRHATPTQTNFYAPQKLGTNVSFFRVGQLHHRTLVVYMKKKGPDSHFYLLEPVVDKIQSESKPSGLGVRIGIQRARADWFRTYKDFLMECEAYDVVFLKARLAVLCNKGFRITEVNGFSSVSIPTRDDQRHTQIAKRCEISRALGFFRTTDDEFLLCYSDFGLYVDKHGDPSRHFSIVEWDGLAESAALHPPYIILFGRSFIEVRHIDTGRLCQIIQGTDMRCTWDGQSLEANHAIAPASRLEDEDIIQDARIHGVMTLTEPMAMGLRPVRSIPQLVFELVPTVPLYLPGSLAGPTAYYPESMSPPRSPPTITHHLR